MQNVLFVVSGPSGVGKGTLVKLLLKENPALALSVSCTTRAPRAGERNGKDYFFVSREEFQARLKEGDFLEYDEHFGNYYGTPKSFVWEQLKEKSVLLEIDVVGALKVKDGLKTGEFPRVVLVMVVPPDVATLEKRLAGRQSETEEERLKRLDRVRYELEQQEKYDYVVVNDDLQEAKRALQAIIEREINAKKGDIK